MSIIEQELKAKGINIVDLKDYEDKLFYDPESKKYFESLDQIKKYYNEIDFKMPRFAYGVEYKPFRLPPLEYILSESRRISLNSEDIIGLLSGVSELEKAIETFNNINEDIGEALVVETTIVKLY